MSKDRYSYVAVFSYEEDGISIEFPDLPGCLPCAEKDNTEEALKNAKEALGLHIWGMEQDGEEIPVPTPITSIHLDSNEVPVLIEVFMPPVRERINSRFVKKTLSLPAWLAAKADEDGVPAAVDDPAEDITAKLVGAEGVLQAGVHHHRVIVLLVIGIGGNQGGKDGHQDHQDHDCQADQGKFILTQLIPDHQPLAFAVFFSLLRH